MNQPYGGQSYPSQPYYSNQPGSANLQGGYGQPYPNQGYGPQTVYVEERRRGGGNKGLLAAICAGLCCGCCLEECCDDGCCCCGCDC